MSEDKKKENKGMKEFKEKSLEKAFEAKDYYKKNTKKCLIWIVIIIFALAILGKIYKSIKGAIANAATPKGVAVIEEEIELKDINNEIVYPAKIEAEDNVNVVLKATGEVTRVNVKLGDYVYEGQILFTIDSSTIALSQAAASASYEAAQAAYNQATNGSSDNNANRLNEALELMELGAMSADAFNGIVSQLDLSKAQVNQAQVALKQANDALDGCYVKAPISGYVSQLNVKEKQMVQAGMAPVTIVNSNKLEINLSVSESVISQINKDDDVTITLNSFPGEEFTGKIDAISIAAGQTSTYPVVIKFDNPDDKIKSGMFGKVIFKTNKIEKCIAIDTNAIIENGDDKYVFIEEDNKAKKIDVEVGINNGKEAEIISGLKVGDKLIIQGQNYLDDGDSVRVVEG